jgi:hypothetical protein
LTAILPDLIADNPFYVLGLPADCPTRAVEREGQKLLAMLAVGLAEAKQYRTPVGARPRTDEKVRAAMAELRDPARRLVHELFARLAVAEPALVSPRLRFPAARRIFGRGVPRGR